MELALTVVGVVVAPIALGFLYGLLMNVGVDPLGVGGGVNE